MSGSSIPPTPGFANPQDQLNAIMLMMTQMRQEAQDRDTVLRNEIAVLKSAAQREAPTNILELIDYTTNEMCQIRDGIQKCDQPYVDTWTAAGNWYRLNSNLKEAFSKAAKGEKPDPKSVEISSLFKDFAKSIKGGKGKTAEGGGSSDSSKKCTRCKHRGHIKKNCFAKVDADGIKLEEE